MLVVDSHPVVVGGVRLFTRHSDQVEMVGSAETGEEAVEQARRDRPDVVLVDGWLPDMLRAEVIRRIRLVSPATKVIIFAAQVTPAVLAEATQLGVHGILGKSATPEHFIEVLCRVAAGERVSGRVSEGTLRRAADKLNCRPLTAREHEILQRAALGESNAEIAKAICLAPTTVKSYLHTAFPKLEARNRVEAIARLTQLGLL